MTDLIVFRYGHRLLRDERVTTHCCLVARAFGCKKIIIHGMEDPILIKTVQSISDRFGGTFKIEFTENWKPVLQQLKQQKYTLVHLTMYGQLIQKAQKKLKKTKKIAIIIGSQKVPSDMYTLSDYNVSVTNQPHSEISALAVVLDRLQDSTKIKFKKAKIKIIPTEKGKQVKIQK
ncbi:MAG: tRNA (cytidine(56)-2'-O)-methyltransferase [Candidatus Diapherotrites archaeon]|nr:tRNA (cytidine(56)-2'-O)-methyltransferase [Candidatus Diapherotrites archaeon]